MGCHFLLQDLNPGVESASPALAGRFFTAEPPGKQITSLQSSFEKEKEKKHRDLEMGHWTQKLKEEFCSFDSRHFTCLLFFKFCKLKKKKTVDYNTNV